MEPWPPVTCSGVAIGHWRDRNQFSMLACSIGCKAKKNQINQQSLFNAFLPIWFLPELWSLLV